jgi:DnaJ-class molecular chaperone
MTGKSHFRVRGVTCGKCDRIHTWYKYRVWREGKKVKEKYVGKCDEEGNDVYSDAESYWNQAWKQWEQAYTKQQRHKIPTPERTPYEILGVSYTVTKAQIKQAYLRLVKQYHPDRNKHIDPRIIVEINVAYQTLTK